MHLTRRGRLARLATIAAALVGLAATGLGTASAAGSGDVTTVHLGSKTITGVIHWLPKPVPFTPHTAHSASANVKPMSSGSVQLDEFVNWNSGGCLDVHESGTGNFTNVDQYQCNGTAAQKFFLVQTGTLNSIPVVELVNWNSDKCVEVYESQTQNGANVDQYQCNSTNTQAWLFTQSYDGSIWKDTFTNLNANKLMEVYGSSTQDFANVDVWQNNGSATQVWLPYGEGTGICVGYSVC
jgi:hypothetical protein